MELFIITFLLFVWVIYLTFSLTIHKKILAVTYSVLEGILNAEEEQTKINRCFQNMHKLTLKTIFDKTDEEIEQLMKEVSKNE